MPLNNKSFSSFVEKVHEEASAAAQAVYDKHQAELDRRIFAQLSPGHTLYVGMGTACLAEDNNNISLYNEFIKEVSGTQYWDQVRAGFLTKDIYAKPKIEK
jgi:hypothetical protein